MYVNYSVVLNLISLMTKKKAQSTGRPPKYGEKTRMFRKRVPVSHHAKIEKIVLDYLEPLIVNKKNKVK